MKVTRLLLLLLPFLPAVFAAEPLTEAFQRGLLAEESQRDLKAAATAYGEVIRQADAQRELVATALFRLAEAQRRLGQTNEARAHYRRLVREFVEQTNLVSLAQAHLPAPAGSAGVQLLEGQLAQARQSLAQTLSDQAELADAIQRVRGRATVTEMASDLATQHPSDELKRLRAEWNQTELALARLSPDFGEQHPEVLRLKRGLAKLAEQLQAEITSILDGLSQREAALRRQVEAHGHDVQVLEARLAQERADAGATALGERPVNELERLLQEEIRLAEAQAADLQQRREKGVASQAEVFQAQRDVLALKRQLAGLAATGLSLMPALQAQAAAAAPLSEARPRWASVGGEVKQPGTLKLPDDRSMDLFEAIQAQGGLTAKGNPNRIQVGRGTNLFRFKLDELMTNRFELQHEDKIQVMERVF